ncbi:MAG: hypothetical protein IJB97_07310 [Clostridia bacterium]|nr:hypothetical protein [Clostridia bacterium]
MSKKTPNNPKTVILFIGIVLCLLGVIFAVIGGIDFISSLAAKSSPTKLWSVFLAFPCLGIGAGFSVFALKNTPPKNDGE